MRSRLLLSCLHPLPVSGGTQLYCSQRSSVYASKPYVPSLENRRKTIRTNVPEFHRGTSVRESHQESSGGDTRRWVTTVTWFYSLLTKKECMIMCNHRSVLKDGRILESVKRRIIVGSKLSYELSQQPNACAHRSINPLTPIVLL